MARLSQGRAGRETLGPQSGIQFVFSGGPELATALRELADFSSKTTARNALSRGLVKACQPMVDAAKALAPKDSGGLAASIIASTKLSRAQKRNLKRRVGEKPGKTEIVSQVFVGPSKGGAHGALVEFGTVPRFHKAKSGSPLRKPVGRIARQPFMRPAFDATSGQVIANFAPAVKAEIEKSAARARRKQMRALRK